MRIGPGYREAWLWLVAEVTPSSITRLGFTDYAGNYGSVRACAQAKASVAPRARLPSTRKVAPESLTSTPTPTAAQTPRKPAPAKGAGGSEASTLRRLAMLAQIPAMTSQKRGLPAALAKSSAESWSR